MVNGYHPNIWKFLDVLMKDQGLNDVVAAQAVAGHDPQPGREQYVQNARRILNIVADYANRNIVDYLRGIAYNIHM